MLYNEDLETANFDIASLAEHRAHLISRRDLELCNQNPSTPAFLEVIIYAKFGDPKHNRF